VKFRAISGSSALENPRSPRLGQDPSESVDVRFALLGDRDNTVLDFCPDPLVKTFTSGREGRGRWR
jgi:hypothetical protein